MHQSVSGHYNTSHGVISEVVGQNPCGEGKKLPGSVAICRHTGIISAEARLRISRLQEAQPQLDSTSHLSLFTPSACLQVHRPSGQNQPQRQHRHQT